MQVCLESEIVEKLTHRGVSAYVAVVMAGNVEATTATLAGLVKAQTAVMLEGLKELATTAPECIVRSSKGKWRCGDCNALTTLPVQISDSSSRYAAFVDDLKKYWDWQNHSVPPFTMGGADGAAIRQFLRDHPSWTQEHWREALRNRGKSPVARSAPIYTWVRKLGEYAAGPLNEYGRPQEGTGKHGQAISVEQANSAARSAARANRTAAQG